MCDGRQAAEELSKYSSDRCAPRFSPSNCVCVCACVLAKIAREMDGAEHRWRRATSLSDHRKRISFLSAIFRRALGFLFRIEKQRTLCDDDGVEMGGGFNLSRSLHGRTCRVSSYLFLGEGVFGCRVVLIGGSRSKQPAACSQIDAAKRVFN